MLSWLWESFEEVIKSYAPVVDDHGPLASPIYKFTILRDTDLRLQMETEAPISSTEPTSPEPACNVRVNDDRVTFTSSLGFELEAIGVEATRTNRHFIGIPPCVTTQSVRIHRLVGRLPRSDAPLFAVDWIENFPSEYLWCDHVETTRSDSSTVVVGGVPPSRPKIEVKGDSRHKGGAWAAAGLNVDGVQLYVCSLKDLSGARVKRPGCIIYSGVPSDEFRDKVRRCISYVLGSYLVYLGVSRFDANWHLTDFEAISPYSMGGLAMRLPPMPPSPLGGPRGFWDLDPGRLSRMVNVLYTKYEGLNFGALSWAYWHAVVATPHIGAVHYGAALESLQRSYLSSSSLQPQKTVVDEEAWEKIRSALEASLTPLGLSAKSLGAFKNKIRNLNSRSQHSTSKDLMDDLGLVLSDREKQAHNARHEAAHGKDDEVDIEWIQDLKLLRILFHRMLLAMTQANDEYYDYFTVKNPVRRLKDPVPAT